MQFWSLTSTSRLCPQSRMCATQSTDTARTEYLQQQAPHHDNLTIEQSGFCINPAFPQVGASPDGLVSCDCCGQGCLEVKCPAKHKHSTVQEACDADKDFCLHRVDGIVQLKQGHRYYTQVQTQMFVTGATYCDLTLPVSCQMSASGSPV